MLLLVISNAAIANPGGGTPVCIQPGATTPPGNDEVGNPAHHLWVYVENDLYYELRNGTPTTADNALSATQMKRAIVQAMEIWNTQSRHITLVYGGTLNAETAAEFCSQTTQRPAVFVNYVQHSQNPGGGTASVRTAQPCGERNMEIWAKNSAGAYMNWPIGSQGATFVNTLVHEFGHVVGLGHAHEASPPTCYSVMAYPSCDGTDNSAGRHLKNYDKDCAFASFTYGRSLRTYVRGISSGGTLQTLGLIDDSQEKGFMHGPAALSTTYRFLHYSDSGSRYTNVGTDGYFSWSNFAYLGAPSPYQDLLWLDEPPVLMGIQDHGWSVASNGTRVFFLDDENDGSTSTMYNPPYVQYVRSNTLLSTSTGDETLEQCDSSCNNHPPVRSHLPVASAWDPRSGHTVFAVAATTSTESDDGGGKIRLYPGFFSSSYYNRLKGSPVATVPGTRTLGAWSADASTDQPIGLACADASWPDTHNCMVAWTDKDLYVGEVHYAYFRVTSAQEIEFKINGFYHRIGSESASGPTIAFIDGDFWLAYRNVEQSVITYQRNYAPLSWYIAAYEPNLFPIVEGPTFAFRHAGEAALTYSVSE